MAMDNIVLTGGARMLQQARTVGDIADARVARACVALRAYHATFWCVCVCQWESVCECVCVREREEIERAKEKVYCIGNTARDTHKSNNN